MQIEDLKDGIPVVEQALERLGVNLEVSRTDNPFRWVLHKGSANIMVQLKESTTLRGKRSLLIVFSPVVQFPTEPERRLAFCERILELTHSAPVVSFSKFEEMACLKSTRFLRGLDYEEVMDIINDFALSADMIDDKLIQEFGVKKA